MSWRARPGFLWALLLVLVAWLGLTGAQVAGTIATPVSADGGFIAGIGVAVGVGLPGVAFALKLLLSLKGGGVNPEAIRGEVTWQVELSAAIRDLGKTQDRLAGAMDNQAEHFRLYVEESEEYRAAGRQAMEKIDRMNDVVSQLAKGKGST